MGRTSTMGIRRIEKTHVFWTSTTTTGLRKKVLPSSRHIIIWCGHRTLAGGKTPHTIAGQATKTHFTPYSLLLGHIHTNWKELQHLRKRTASHDESPRPLETIPRMDKRTIHNHDGSCKSTILEVTQEPELTNGTVASGPTRIWLWNTTHPRQGKHPSRRTLPPPWSQPREKR